MRVSKYRGVGWERVGAGEEKEKREREKSTAVKKEKRERGKDEGRWLVGPGRKRTPYRSRMVGPIPSEIP
jgi:hypothetical protein